MSEKADVTLGKLSTEEASFGVSVSILLQSALSAVNVNSSDEAVFTNLVVMLPNPTINPIKLKLTQLKPISNIGK